MSENKTDNTARILMFSQRNINQKFHYRCTLYQFEDIIRKIDSVEFLEPKLKNWLKNGNRAANRLEKLLAITINPKIKVKKHYDLFFAVCQLPRDLLYINIIEEWNTCCKTSICWLDEIWIKVMLRFKLLYKYFFKILSKFDYVILSCSQSVNAVNEAVKGKCFYLPNGVDAILFCPYPNPPQRFIDLYNFGRRSEVTHQALLKMVKENKIFYVYDSITGKEVFKSNEHRLLLANTAKRSRYFIANPGKFDQTNETGNQSEIGSRYFEGAASGTIMFGEIPKNDEFKKIFHWPDAVIHLTYDSNDIDKIINEMDKQPERQNQIRKNNVTQALLKHDWVYRWETVLKIAGLEPMAELLERKKRLKNLSEMVE